MIQSSKLSRKILLLTLMLIYVVMMILVIGLGYLHKVQFEQNSISKIILFKFIFY